MSQDNIPVPDPTALTLDLIRREMKSLKKLLETRMDGEQKIIKQKFRGVAGQIQLLIATTGKANDAKIDDIKARLDRGDGKIVGQAYKDTSGDRAGAFVFSVIAALLGISSLVFSIIVFATRH